MTQKRQQVSLWLLAVLLGAVCLTNTQAARTPAARIPRAEAQHGMADKLVASIAAQTVPGPEYRAEETEKDSYSYGAKDAYKPEKPAYSGEQKKYNDYTQDRYEPSKRSHDSLSGHDSYSGQEEQYSKGKVDPEREYHSKDSSSYPKEEEYKVRWVDIGVGVCACVADCPRDGAAGVRRCKRVRTYVRCHAACRRGAAVSCGMSACGIDLPCQGRLQWRASSAVGRWHDDHRPGTGQVSPSLPSQPLPASRPNLLCALVLIASALRAGPLL